MAYEKTVWVNGQAPALDADHLNKIEQGIADAVSVTAQSLTDEQKAQARTNINAAPGGFGLGGSAVIPPNNSLDDAKETGLYVCSPSYIGAPSGHEYIGYGVVLSMKRGDSSVIQVYWSEASNNITGTPLNLVRRYNGTQWYPWEWVNPPMLTGVEYRTTERYWGKPVYTQVINCGSMPNIDNSKSVSIAAFNVSVVTFISGWCTYYSATFGENLLGMTMSANNLNIVVFNLNREFNNNAVMYAQIKYTKTTD